VKTEHSLNEKYFAAVVKFRWPVIILTLLVMIGSASFLPKLTKDTTAGAFFAKDDPAILYRDQVETEFGLTDPIVVAIMN